MIKLLSVFGSSGGDGSAKAQMVSLFADTKVEVTNSITGADVVGMEDDMDIDAGSIVRTASFDIASMNSSHTWIWKS